VSSSSLAAGAGANAAALTDAVRHLQLTDVPDRAEEVIRLVSAALAGAPPAEAAAAAAAAAAGSNSGSSSSSSAAAAASDAQYRLARLRADVEVALSSLKNAAYAAGYSAGKGELVAAATRAWA
jgi:hypothetical protein